MKKVHLYKNLQNAMSNYVIIMIKIIKRSSENKFLLLKK